MSTPDPEALKGLFLLEPDMIYLNHGAFGATPATVLQAASAWRLQMERQPMRFMLHELPGALRAAADRLAARLGAQGEDLVFLENATSGVNAVVRSLALGPGDQVLMFDQGYPACLNAARWVCEQAGAELVTVPLPFPHPTDAGILQAVADGLGPRVRLAILDHITSGSAVLTPMAELVQLCRDKGVPILVDGAHAPGMIPLDLTALDADYYVGNCHKWLLAPKGCALLWTRSDRQAGLHPTTISHGLDQGYTTEFDWIGTRDHSPWLAVTAALDLRDALGEDWIQARNRDLVWQGAELLSDAWDCEISVPRDRAGSIITLPAPIRLPPTWDAAHALQDRIWDAHRIMVPGFPIHDRVWLRISAQLYNTLDDYARLAEALPLP